MRIATKLFDANIELGDDEVYELVIENHRVLYCMLSDIYNQIQGNEGDTVLSDNDDIIKISKNVELITNYIPFDLNEKRLITKIQGLLEREAMNVENFQKTMTILADIERYVYGLAELFPYELDFKGITAASLIKMCGLTIVDDSFSIIERIFNYMSIVTELLGEKLFVFSNIRAYFNDDDMQKFVSTVINHKYKVLLIENCDRKRLEKTRRLIIDNDLCII